MLGLVDLFRLLDGPVVEPQHHVVVVGVGVKGRARHGHGLVRVVREDGQRACRVEPDTPDRVRIDVVLGDGAVYRVADTAPDVVGGLFLEDGGSMVSKEISSRQR